MELAAKNYIQLKSICRKDETRMGEDWRSRITVDPKVLVGEPIIKGTRISH